MLLRRVRAVKVSRGVGLLGRVAGRSVGDGHESAGTCILRCTDCLPAPAGAWRPGRRLGRAGCCGCRGRCPPASLAARLMSNGPLAAAAQHLHG